jgi:1-acyl-sn-glycerol-3-phosphate acyltransferase
MSQPPATLLDKVVSVGLWGLSLSYLATAAPAITFLYRRYPADKIDHLTHLYCRGQVLTTFCRWRAEVDPAVDPKTVYAFAQNHVNVLDYVTMYNASPHFKQGVELREHFKIPFYGPFMQHRGTIPVDRDAPNGKSELTRLAQIEVDKGRSLLMFPEGTRTRDGRVGKFHNGLFHVARNVGVPVVPVAVTGMTEVLGTGSWIMRPFQEVTVHLMEPVPTAGLRPEDVPELTRQVRDRIVEKVDAYYAAREAKR